MIYRIADFNIEISFLYPRTKIFLSDYETEKYDKIDINIFNSVQNVNLDTIISYRKGDEFHHFLDDYGNKNKED